MYSVNIIGCGKVGSVLGRLLCQSGLYHIGSLYDQHPDKSQAAQSFMGSGHAVDCYEALQRANFYCLSVTDDAISKVCEQMVNSVPTSHLSHCIVFHCSGALSAAVLKLAETKGACVASLHPVFSFNTVHNAFSILSQGGAFFVMESSNEWARSQLKAAVKSIKGRVVELTAENKLLYHAGLVMMSSYMPVLFEASLNLLKASGLNESESQALSRSLMADISARLMAQTGSESLTGPVVRGDCKLLAQELNAISQSSVRWPDLYRQLGEYAVGLVEEKGELNKSVLGQLRKLFSSSGQQNA